MNNSTKSFLATVLAFTAVPSAEEFTALQSEARKLSESGTEKSVKNVAHGGLTEAVSSVLADSAYPLSAPMIHEALIARGLRSGVDFQPKSIGPILAQQLKAGKVALRARGYYAHVATPVATPVAAPVAAVSSDDSTEVEVESTEA